MKNASLESMYTTKTEQNTIFNKNRLDKLQYLMNKTTMGPQNAQVKIKESTGDHCKVLMILILCKIYEKLLQRSTTGTEYKKQLE